MKKINYEFLNIFIANFKKRNKQGGFDNFDIRESLKIFFRDNEIKKIDFRKSENKKYLKYVYKNIYNN